MKENTNFGDHKRRRPWISNGKGKKNEEEKNQIRSEPELRGPDFSPRRGQLGADDGWKVRDENEEEKEDASIRRYGRRKWAVCSNADRNIASDMGSGSQMP